MTEASLPSGNADYRLEALKLAFDTAIKADMFNKRQTPEERYELIVSIQELADINYNYIVNSNKLLDRISREENK